ncbi:uncharacterized protein LOC143849925 isoform X3 [Tasmannia lanceolata]|uniref:uncharacterized protein LOC143849925 isoform X3 n=1 Tax=Tasmannia lanceolata TaxID=3420 RepID=UPI00406326BA
MLHLSECKYRGNEQEGGTDGDSLLISGLCQSRSRFSFAIVMGSCSLDKQQRKTRGEPAAKAFHKIFSYFLQQSSFCLADNPAPKILIPNLSFDHKEAWRLFLDRFLFWSCKC